MAKTFRFASKCKVVLNMKGGFLNPYYDLKAYDEGEEILSTNPNQRCPVQEKADRFQQALFHHYYLLKRRDIEKINRQLRVDLSYIPKARALSSNLSAQEKSFDENPPVFVDIAAAKQMTNNKENAANAANKENEPKPSEVGDNDDEEEEDDDDDADYASSAKPDESAANITSDPEDTAEQTLLKPPISEDDKPIDGLVWTSLKKQFPEEAKVAIAYQFMVIAISTFLSAEEECGTVHQIFGFIVFGVFLLFPVAWEVRDKKGFNIDSILLVLYRVVILTVLFLMVDLTPWVCLLEDRSQYTQKIIHGSVLVVAALTVAAFAKFAHYYQNADK